MYKINVFKNYNKHKNNVIVLMISLKQREKENS